MLTDTHCHLGRYHDAASVLRSVKESSTRVIVATEDPDEYRRLQLRLRGVKQVVVGLGLHPAGRAARIPSQLGRFFRLLPDAEWISEVGIDFDNATDRIERRGQIDLFEAILSHSMMRSKILSVHSRGAAREVVERLSASKQPAVLHWFSGSFADLEVAVAAGLFFSVNERMARSRRGPSLLARIPPDRLLLETDGPFATDQLGQPLEPTGLVAVLNLISQAWDWSATDVESRVEANFDSLVAQVHV